MYRPLLALVLAGCSGDCPTFEEMEVTDPHGLDTSGTLARIHAAIDDFALWSGREGVCVEEVRLEQPDDESWNGSYGGRLVRISPRTAADPSGTVWHELCHGLDFHEGLSWPNRELFPALPGSESERGGVGQAFAHACEPGVDDLAVLDLLPACGAPTDHFMRDVVWAGWDGARELATAPIGLERREVGGMPASGYMTGVASGAEALYLGLTGADEDAPISIIRIDPSHPAAVTSIEGPAVSPGGRWALVGGEEDPLLVVFDGGATAWRVRGAALVPAAFPQEITGLHGGILAGGAAWLDATVGGETALRRVDLATLVVTDVSTAGGGEDAHLDLRGLRAGSGTVTAPFWGEGSRNGLARLSTADGTWTFHDASPGILAQMGLPLPDGRLLVRWLGPLGDDGTYGFGVFDPVTGAWTLDDETCGANAMNSGGSFALLDGEPYWLEWADVEEGDPTFGLVELTVPPR